MTQTPSSSNPDGELNHVAISGSSGMIGSALCRRFKAQGTIITRIVRKAISSSSPTPSDKTQDPQAHWDPKAGTLQAQPLEGMDAVVHLAGEPILGRWTGSKRQRIWDSRVQATTLVSQTLAGLACKPKVLLCGSAIGIYGDRGDQILTEQSPPGDAGQGFLRRVCEQWEQATQPAVEAGIRVVNLRTGLVLSRNGGTLKLMIPAFKLGLGGTLGHGQQWMSWITLDDLIGVIGHCLDQPALTGPVNAVSPNPVTNRQFTKTLAHLLHRPALAPAPAPLLKAVLGEPAREMLLASARVQPDKLRQSQYPFIHPNLEPALRAQLNA